ncbi:MAG: hypothetical protein A3C36_01060 [Omnitrophica WOR_2 bacterium RIFCSPHIGHO2_02_FULL_52_10]|nr:MAG: hypothetical protein A3C36_01060 [Omnitrophica WOR_2 bacterium RIFCSPHIGHO2_02_FULL_52_10]
MMNKILVLMCALMLSGCAYGRDYLENPEKFIRDPHFTEYKNKRDALESSYLRKEITYAEYIEQRDRLDDKYDQEVQKRTSVIMSNE